MNLKSTYRLLFVLIFNLSFLNMTVEIWNTNLQLAEEIDEESDSVAEEDVAFFSDELIQIEESRFTTSLLSERSRLNNITFKAELVSEVHSPPPEFAV